jgi:hypothetical protein
MGKYLIMWEADESKIPVDPQERKTGWLGAIEMVKQDKKNGVLKEWGVFLSQPNGFDIVEGTETEVHQMALKYIPYFRMKIYPYLSVEKAEEAIKAM